MAARLCALALLTASPILAQMPSIEAEGSAIKVVGSDFVVTLNNGDPMSFLTYMGSVESRLGNLESQLTVSQSTATGLQSQLTGTQSQLAVSQSNVAVLNTSLQSLNASVLTNNGQATLRFVAIETAMAEAASELDVELADIVSQIGAVEAAIPNSSATDALAARQAEITELLNRLHHPVRSVVYGPFVTGDDQISAASCPDGLLLTSCNVELRAGPNGNYLTDGIQFLSSSACAGIANALGGVIRIVVECSNLHPEVTVVQTSLANGWSNTMPQSVDCPAGQRALHCACYSPWGRCGLDGFGITPTADGNCVASNALASGTGTPHHGQQVFGLCVPEA